MGSIAGCPKGFVVSWKNRLYCFDLGFGQAAESVSTPGAVSALCTGDGDDVWVATLGVAPTGPRISRYTTSGSSVQEGEPLRGKLADLRAAPVSALAFDPRTKVLYAAQQDKSITNFNTVTGESGKIIGLRRTRIVAPTSLAVLSDGSLVIAGQTAASRDSSGGWPAEGAWTFAAYRFKDGELAESYERDTGAPIAVAAAGAGLVAIDHSEQGHLWIWPRSSSLSEAPQPELMLAVADADQKPAIDPKWAMKLAVFRRKAFVLDMSPVGDVQKDFSLFRKRLKVFDLQD